jgi:valyl-tRNA synthetase
VKPRLAAGDQSARAASAVLLHAWDTVLRLLHPVVPFITEELWQKLPGRRAGELLISAPWPTPDRQRIDPRVEAEFGAVQQAITAIRNIRAEYRVSPKVKLAAAIRAAGPAARGVFESERDTIVRLAQLESVTSDGAALQGAHAVLSDGSEVVVALTGAIDLGQECRRLSDELTRLDKQLEGLVAKLANEQFIARAPQDVVTRERQKEQAWRTQRDALAGKLAALGCG